MADEPVEYVSLNALATELGIAWKSARKHVRSGLFKAVTHGANKGRYNLARCRDLYEAARDPVAVEKGDAAREAAGQIPSASPVPNTLVQARTASLVFEAKRRELSLQKLKGQLIDRDAARKACLAVISVVNQRLDGLPAQAAPAAHAAATPAEAETLIRSLVRAIKVELAKLAEAPDAV